MLDWIFVFVAYLVGSLSAAIIICRLLDLPDPREEGSGNPGATNVFRLGGKKAAAYTLAMDCLKGWLPVFIAGQMDVDGLLLACVGLAAFLGHLYPVFFGFRGGKGVATALGVLAGFNWLVAVALIVSWAMVARLFKISSLAALIASAVAPLYVWWLGSELSLIVASVVISVLLVWRHRGNIQRLRTGDEHRIGR